ncbi:MAG: signal peptidase II [Lachnospiraceae bacterium]|nr:signal peptidase II [Lachnospiraceae bacterium]
MLDNRTSFNKKGKGFLAFFLSTAVLIWLDQWTKRLAVAHLKDQPEIVIIKGVFELRYLENRGAAFGMLQGRQLFFFLVAAVVLAVVIYALLRMPFTKRYLPLGGCMVLLVAGALGNMIDRISQQFVVDFLYFSLIDFPIFNVADCYVTVAAFLLIVLIMWYYKDEDLMVFSWKRGEQA